MQKHSAYRLTYALNATGQLVDVDKVPVGNKCGCFCPACKEPLIAKIKGQNECTISPINQEQNAIMQ